MSTVTTLDEAFAVIQQVADKEVVRAEQAAARRRLDIVLAIVTGIAALASLGSVFTTNHIPTMIIAVSVQVAVLTFAAIKFRILGS